MYTTQEAHAAAAAAAAVPTTRGEDDAVDGALFTEELHKASAETRQQSIEKLLKRLAAEIPGGSINRSGTEATIRAAGDTTITISTEMMDMMGASEEQYAKIVDLVNSLVDASQEQALVGTPNGNTRRNITIEGSVVRYVETQRTARGTQLSISSIAMGGESSQALVDARRSGTSGFQGMFSAQDWRFQSTMSSQAWSSVSEISTSSMEVIIQQWAGSGQSSQMDIMTYMMMMGLVDPLVLDLGDEGFNLSSAEDGVYFDIKGDGSPVKTGFIQGNNAFLYLDQNGNGVVDDVRELFGDFGGHANGFDNLAQYDDNGDGVIDEQDAIYQNLRLWRDLNGDGVNQLEESMTLAEAGIKSINLGYNKQYEKDAHGNVIGERSTFERTDGTTGNVADVWLRNA